MIQKKDREARKLEILEAEILKRLRDTTMKQQQAIEMIQEIKNNRQSPRNAKTTVRSSTDLDHVNSLDNVDRKPFNHDSEALTPMQQDQDGLNTVSEVNRAQENVESPDTIPTRVSQDTTKLMQQEHTLQQEDPDNVMNTVKTQKAAKVSSIEE